MMRNVLTTCLLAAAVSVPVAAQKQTCTVTSFGKGCGPILTGSVTPTGNTNRVTMTMTKAAPNARLLLMVGGATANIGLQPFFGGPADCKLLLVPIFFQQHVTDSNGTYSSARSVGAFIGTAHAQFAELVVRPSGNVHFLTTNVVTLTCK